MHGEDTYCCWVETDPEDQNYCERQMFVRFEVLTVVSVQILTFLVVTPCTALHYIMSQKSVISVSWCILNIVVYPELCWLSCCVYMVFILHSLPVCRCL